MSKKRHFALGCHIYAGGHTIGVRRAGFEVTTHLEEGAFGAETSRRNLGVDVRVGIENWRAAEFGGLIDWLYTNPPCASFSQAGHAVKDKEARNVRRFAKDDRTNCALRCFDLIDVVKPTVFSWECVAAATTAGDEFVKKRIEFCHARGYDVHGLLFDAADLGLPSRRRRFFFVASKVAFAPTLTPHPHVTVREAWRGLDPGPVVACRTIRTEILKRMPRGVFGKLANYAVVGQVIDGKKYGKPGFLHWRIGWDKPAPTVTGGQHLYHPDLARPLTIREQQVLCGYPATYEFSGRPSVQYAEIAKAVTPHAAEWLARQVRRALDADERVGRRKRRAKLWNFLPEGGPRYATSWSHMPGGE